jgi:D-alanine-D-alanine ligase
MRLALAASGQSIFILIISAGIEFYLQNELLHFDAQVSTFYFIYISNQLCRLDFVKPIPWCIDHNAFFPIRFHFFIEAIVPIASEGGFLSAQLSVGVIFGGRSGEHEVSLVSAQSIITALNPDMYQVIPIGISRDGRWYSGADVLNGFKKGLYPQNHRVILPAEPMLSSIFPWKNGEIDKQGKIGLDVIIIAMHGPYGEDGKLQGLLDYADIPYVGAGVLGSALSMDKVFQKQICSALPVPGTDYLWMYHADWLEDQQGNRPVLEKQLGNSSRDEMLEKIFRVLKSPVFVKPANLGSSVGISKAYDYHTLINAIEAAFRYDHKVIIEKAVHPVREFEVSILGNIDPRASVVGEVIPSNEFYDYDAKYIDNASKLCIPADIPAELAAKIQQAAIQTFLCVGAAGMARVDFLYNPGSKELFVNEINTIPGFTNISMFSKLWQASGLTYRALLDELIQLALQRAEQTRNLQSSYTPKKEWYREET